jgi:hypothetical protein
MCGRQAWHSGKVTEIRAVETVWESSAVATGLVVEGIFDEFGGPLPFEDLVDRVAHHWGIADRPEPHFDNSEASGNIDSTIQNRSWLKQLWDEVRALPPRQRAALLLNLRDDQGGSALLWLPITGVAAIRDIAVALELPVEEMARIWNSLPLDDLQIAARMNITRQQVVNLRKAARERLVRRMR